MGEWSNREIARDILGLASIPFYAIVTVRAVIGGYPSFLIRLLVGAAVLLMIYFAGRMWHGQWIREWSKANGYIARGIVICACSMFYYRSTFFSVFAFLLLIGLYVSARHLGSSGRSLAGGTSIGVIALALAMAITPIVMTAFGLNTQ